MKYILIILLAMFSVSCVTQKTCNKKYPPQVTIITKDSIVVKDSVVYKLIDVPVYIKGDTIVKSDTIILKDGNNLINSEPIYVETKFAKAIAQIKDSNINLKLIQKDTLFQVQILAKEAFYWKEKYNKEVNKEVITKKYVPKFYIVTSYAGIISLVLLIIWVIFKLRRFINPFWPR